MGLVKHYINNVILGVGSGSTPVTPDGLISRVTYLEDTLYEYELFEVITSGTSGKITPPQNCTILLDQYTEAADCLITKVDSANRPIDKPAYSGTGALITSTFDNVGNYVLSATPAFYPVALIYQVSIKGKYVQNIPLEKIADEFQIATVSSASPESMELTRDASGNIESIDYTNKPTLYISRDGNGNILSYQNGIYKWTIEKTNEIITGITVEEI